MDWFQFSASVIGSLAWPGTIVIAIFILKNNLPLLFPFVERLKYKDFEVEFRESVQELTEQSRTTLSTPDEQNYEPQDRLYTLAEISPRSAILEAWLQVEAAAADALQLIDPQFVSKRPTIASLRLGEYLNRRQIINGRQLEIFQRLRELRNRAVHVGDAVFKVDEVLEYVALATSLASHIKKRSYVH